MPEKHLGKIVFDTGELSWANAFNISIDVVNEVIEELRGVKDYDNSDKLRDVVQNLKFLDEHFYRGPK